MADGEQEGRGRRSRSGAVPIGLALALLTLLNAGLYLRLSGSPQRTRLADEEAPGGRMPGEWIPAGGQWDVQDGTFVQTSEVGFDHRLVSSLRLEQGKAYRIEVRVRSESPLGGGGLLFNVKLSRGLAQAACHLVRLDQQSDGLYLLNGYVDGRGTFVQQSAIRLEPSAAAEEWRQLAVVVRGDRYRVDVDGQSVVKRLDLMYHGGAIGLTASRARVSFQGLHVEALSLVDRPSRKRDEVGSGGGEG